MVSPEREATPSLLGAEHKLKKRIKLINLFFSIYLFLRPNSGRNGLMFFIA